MYSFEILWKAKLLIPIFNFPNQLWKLGMTISGIFKIRILEVKPGNSGKFVNLGISKPLNSGKSMNPENWKSREIGKTENRPTETGIFWKFVKSRSRAVSISFLRDYGSRTRIRLQICSLPNNVNSAFSFVITPISGLQYFCFKTSLSTSLSENCQNSGTLLSVFLITSLFKMAYCLVFF